MLEKSKNYKFITAPVLVAGIDLQSWIISAAISSISYHIASFFVLGMLAFIFALVVLFILYVFFLINIKNESDFVLIIVNKIKLGRTQNKDFVGNCYVS